MDANVDATNSGACLLGISVLPLGVRFDVFPQNVTARQRRDSTPEARGDELQDTIQCTLDTSKQK